MPTIPLVRTVLPVPARAAVVHGRVWGTTADRELPR